jgi:hypothetical protein
VNGNNVSIDVPINFTGPGATKETVKKFSNGIEKNWTGKFGKYQVKTKVSTPRAGGPINDITIPKGNGRAFTEGSNKGSWPAGRPGWTGAHEAGHLMGLDDQYTDKGPKKGFERNIMGARNGTPSQADIANIIKAHAASSDQGTKKECQ